jgi:hypothetical protein
VTRLRYSITIDKIATVLGMSADQAHETLSNWVASGQAHHGATDASPAHEYREDVIDDCIRRRAALSDVADKIGAKELAVELEELGKLIIDHQEMAEADPLARDVRIDFQGVKKAAVAMERAIDRAWKRLYWLPVDEMDKLSAARDAARAVAKLVDKASARIPRAGRKRARRIAGPNPRELCALIVIEAWTLVRGKPPGAHNLRVQEICDAYWRACGGARIGKRGDPENWRRTMGAALTDNSPMRRSIRNRLQRKMVQNRS